MKKYIFLSITIIITAFIFFQSAMPGDDSQIESDTFFLFFDKFAEALHIPNLFNEGTIRKLAHFVEFSFLGFFLSATVHAFSGFKNQVFKILFFLLAIPVSDEFLQYFSVGRSSQVRDVLLDFSGCLFGFLCLFLLTVLLSAAKRKSLFSISNVHRSGRFCRFLRKKSF